MTKKTLWLLPLVALSIGSCTGESKSSDTITISGTVQFDEPEQKMTIIKRNGFDKEVVGEFDINADGTFEYVMSVEKAGIYTLDCKKWETLNFWAEDEDIKVDFRGRDTAKVKIKNPPYRKINGGPLNEVMNHVNFLSYANYQMMIALSREVYRTDINGDAKSALSGSMYGHLSDDFKRRAHFLADQYADRNSVLAVLALLNDTNPEDSKIIKKTIEKFETVNPNYAPFIEYKEAIEEARYQRERLALGKPAPEFSFPTPDGSNNFGPADFKGKILLVDFWASWCGPCVAEIPHLKEVYANYKAKGVEILSVSIDKSEESWHKALNEQSMPWSQVCAPNAGSEIMKDYQFTGIPYMVLLDENGNILAKNLRGEDIDKAIDAHLAK